MSQADQDIAVEASLKTTGLGSAAVVDDGVVPTIDLSAPDKKQVAEQLWQAATQVGFFSVVGHGIPQSVIDNAFGASADFFAQPLDDKKKQSPGDMKNNAGEHLQTIACLLIASLLLRDLAHPCILRYVSYRL